MTLVLELAIYAFMLCLLIRAVFSFIGPYPKNQIHQFTFRVTVPFFAPVRRLVPPVGGFDIAFLIVFIGVTLILQLVQQIH